MERQFGVARSSIYRFYHYKQKAEREYMAQKDRAEKIFFF